MSRSFTSIRVIDFTTTIAGPHCSRLLCDMGAEVIKIENAEGDMMRTRPPLRDGYSSNFGQLNTGKKSVVLDLKSEAGLSAAKRLISSADVLVENFRPGVMHRFGLAHEQVAAANPRLIYCAISGFGQTGPDSARAAYAPVIHAASGFDLAHIAHQPGRERPDYCGIFIADVLSGTYAFGAIASALFQREQTGQGQFIDVSMLESMLSLSPPEIQYAQFPTPLPPVPMFGPLATKDGFVNVTIASDRTFRSAAKAAGREDWIEDPRFKIYWDRRNYWDQLMAELEAWTRQLSTQDCLTQLDAAGVPAAAYRTIAETMNEPQIVHRGAMQEVEDGAGPFKVLNPPMRLSASECSARSPVPELGQHTYDVLSELGLSQSDIEQATGGMHP